MAKHLPANEGDAGDMGSIPGLGRSSRGENATHSSILAWKIPWTQECGGLQPMRLQSQTQLSTHIHTYTLDKKYCGAKVEEF